MYLIVILYGMPAGSVVGENTKNGAILTETLRRRGLKVPCPSEKDLG
jgi:hypothetical protein